tara:strand:- start:261 stop:527 length:267 start_codon:yes stop_codon:yes gene_type:complete
LNVESALQIPHLLLSYPTISAASHISIILIYPLLNINILLLDDVPNQYNILCDEKQSQIGLVLNGNVEINTFVAGKKPGEPGVETLVS